MLCLEVGNGDILYNFGDREMSGFEVLEGRPPSLSLLPPPTSQETKKTLSQ